MSNTPDRLIIFDDSCGLCHGWVRFVIRFDTQRLFRFAAWQSASGQSVLQQINIPIANMDSIVLVQQGRVYTKSDAFLQTVRLLGFPVNLFAVFWLVPRFVRDWVYDRLAASRYRLFGKRDACQLTNGLYADRFI